MRKTVCALFCLAVSSATFSAEKSIRIINASPSHKMLVKYQVCEITTNDYKRTCNPSHVELPLPQGGFTDVAIPADDPNLFPQTILVITEASAFENSQQVASTKFNSNPNNLFKDNICAGSEDRSVIIFNDYNTNAVVCNDTNKIK